MRRSELRSPVIDRLGLPCDQGICQLRIEFELGAKAFGELVQSGPVDGDDDVRVLGIP